jgi:bifunctional non-homologous end joining protein LigD
MGTDDVDDDHGRLAVPVGKDVVSLASPHKVYFPAHGDRPPITKLDLLRYYVDVADDALVGVRDRPMILKRHVHGIEREPFFQKRAPKGLPSFVRTATLHYRSGNTADEIVVDSAAGLAWLTNLGCIELHVHPVRASDLLHPDELRIDLDPGPGFGDEDVKAVAFVVRDVLQEFGLVGFAKSSGSRGVHIFVRLLHSEAERSSYDDVRRAAVFVAEEVERRLPGVATSTWQKTERHGVLVDFNQNAKDRTTCAAWSVRARPDARVSMPLSWDELKDADFAAHTLFTARARLAAHGDPHRDIDAHAGSLAELLRAAGPKKVKKIAPKKAAVAVDAEDAAVAEVIVVATAATRVDAEDGLARWRLRHPAASAALAVDDVFVDAMRGASSAWWRVRVHLRNVPADVRPPPEDPDPNWRPRRA